MPTNIRTLTEATPAQKAQTFLAYLIGELPPNRHGELLGIVVEIGAVIAGVSPHVKSSGENWTLLCAGLDACNIQYTVRDTKDGSRIKFQKDEEAAALLEAFQAIYVPEEKKEE